jgi:hypothetical protein
LNDSFNDDHDEVTTAETNNYEMLKAFENKVQRASEAFIQV